MRKKAVGKQTLSSSRQPAAYRSPYKYGIQIQLVAGVSSEQLKRCASISSAHTLSRTVVGVSR
eukprot:1015219-Pelagomonas_calceolata.AAC.1